MLTVHVKYTKRKKENRVLQAVQLLNQMTEEILLCSRGIIFIHVPEVFIVEQDNSVTSSDFSCSTADAQIINIVIVRHWLFHTNKRTQHKIDDY